MRLRSQERLRPDVDATQMALKVGNSLIESTITIDAVDPNFRAENSLVELMSVYKLKIYHGLCALGR
jgi:hypothetical protein